MIARLRRAFGFDEPFVVTDVSPPRRTLGATDDHVRALIAQRDDWRELADERVELLKKALGPFASHSEESRVRAAIRRHLRETA